MADLKPPLTGFALHFTPSGKELELLQGLIDMLVQKYNVPPFDAHVTLLPLLDIKDQEAVFAGVEKLAASEHSFSIETIGVGMRNQYFQSVFLTCVPAPEVIRLNTLGRQHFYGQDGPPMMPHWSMVYGDLDVATKQAIKRDIEEHLTFPFLVPITEIAVLSAQGSEKDWKYIQRFPLRRRRL